MAKMEKYGGNPKCIIADPDIFTVPISSDLDFILIGSDGIFDKISTEDTVKKKNYLQKITILLVGPSNKSAEAKYIRDSKAFNQVR